MLLEWKEVLLVKFRINCEKQHTKTPTSSSEVRPDRSFTVVIYLQVGNECDDGSMKYGGYHGSTRRIKISYSLDCMIHETSV